MFNRGEFESLWDETRAAAVHQSDSVFAGDEFDECIDTPDGGSLPSKNLRKSKQFARNGDVRKAAQHLNPVGFLSITNDEVAAKVKKQFCPALVPQPIPPFFVIIKCPLLSTTCFIRF